MPQIINTNLASINAQNNLQRSSMSLGSALQRLSSGMRINSAKDDAAGLAISNRMNAQIGGLNQAARNANDAISLSQTAEGALSGVGDNLQRLRTLAVQAANSTNSDSDRASIQVEVSSLIAEIGRVAQTTQFNGINLLDGTFQNQAFQVGANANQTISVSMESSLTSKLGSTQAAALTADNNGTALGGGDMIINGISVGASTSASDNASSANNSASAIAKAAAINAVSAQTGVTATADVNTVGGTSQVVAALAGTFTINGIATGTVTTAAADTAATVRANVINAINLISGQTGVVAVDGGSSSAGVVLTAADGRNISISSAVLTAAGTGVTMTAGTAGQGFGTFTLTSNKAISITGTAANLVNAGVKAGTYATQTAFASTAASTAAGVAFAAADFTINGIIIGASLATSDNASANGKSASAIAKVAAINAISAQTGVTAKVDSTVVSGSAQTAAALTGTFVINGVATANISTTTDATASRAAVIAGINLISGQTGVTASDGGTSALGVVLTAADGRNISISSAVLTAAAAGVTMTASVAAGGQFGTFTLTSAKTFTVAAGLNGTVMSTQGMLDFGTYGTGKSGQALANVDVSTAAGANAAIVAIDNAISSNNSSRASLGAIQNRFTSTITTLTSAAENLTAAKSRITDADFAAETANLTRGQILQQAGTAMLAQANALPNGILALLR
ncbi:hypothetical protein BH11PSE11_BH11PSE11_16460 [soil metagenome]